MTSGVITNNMTNVVDDTDWFELHQLIIMAFNGNFRLNFYFPVVDG